MNINDHSLMDPVGIIAIVTMKMTLKKQETLKRNLDPLCNAIYITVIVI